MAEAVDRLVEGDRDVAALIPQMMTIGAFETRLQAELLGPVPIIGEFARSLLLYRVLERKYGGRAAGALGGSMDFPGFLDATLQFFDELGAGLVEPETLDRIRGYAPGKERELAAVYRDFKEELVRRGYADSGIVRRRMIDAVSSGAADNCPMLARFGSIRLEDIYQFTPYRFELIRGLARRIPVTIAAPLPDERRKAFGFVVANLGKFEALGDEAGLLDIKFSEPENSPLAPLREKIFNLEKSGEPSPPEDVPVRILSCPSRYREVEEVCADIVNRRAAEGRQWRDFMVVFRDIRPYGAILEDVFGRYGAPFFFKRGMPLSQNPLIRSATSVFTAIDSGYARDDVARIVTSSYFGRFAGVHAALAQTVYLEAGVIDGSPAEWRRRLKKAAAAGKGDEKRQRARIAKATCGLLDRLERLRAQNRPPQFLDHFARLLSWLEISPETDYAGPRADIIRFRDNNAHSQLIETIGEARDAVGRMKMGASALGYGRIRDLLTRNIERRSVPEPGTVDRNRVQALNVYDAVGVRARHVYVCGLHEGEFPLRDSTRPIMSEDERMEFNRKHAEVTGDGSGAARGRRVFEKAADRWQEESLLFYQTLLSARESVTFTYSLQDLDGSPLMTSIFINDLLDALKPGADQAQRMEAIEQVSSLAIEKNADLLIDPEERRMKLLRDIFRGGAGETGISERAARMARGAPAWKRFRNLLSLAVMERRRDRYFAESDPEAKKDFITRSNGGLFTEAGALADILVNKRKGRYSPTALESYGQCPFRYFAGRLLGLEAPVEPALEMDAREAGTMAHEIAERFYRTMARERRLPLSGSDADLATLETETRRVFDKFRKEGRAGEPSLWEGESEKRGWMLRRWLAGETGDQGRTGFAPVAMEEEFDVKPHARSKKARAPYRLATEDGKGRLLIGTIDRVDVNRNENSVRVVDYKLSSNDAKYKKMIKDEALGVTSFQVGVYSLLAAMFAERTGAVETVEKVEAGYRLFPAGDGKGAYITMSKDRAPGAGEWINVETADGRGVTFEELARQTIGRIESGQFPVAPQTCEFCDFPALCRYTAPPQEA